MNRTHTVLLLIPFILVACASPMKERSPDSMPSANNVESSSIQVQKQDEMPSAMSSSPARMERMEKAEKAVMQKEVTSSAAPKKWSDNLTEDQLTVLRDGGTETPFTSPLVDEHRKGTFVSADCGEPLFRSEQKYDSGTGWPSFWAPITPDAVIEQTDSTLGITRTEIKSKCGGHLGHVFSDGPEPTGLRYCMNGLALRFIPDEEQ